MAVVEKHCAANVEPTWQHRRRARKRLRAWKTEDPTPQSRSEHNLARRKPEFNEVSGPLISGTANCRVFDEGLLYNGSETQSSTNSGDLPRGFPWDPHHAQSPLTNIVLIHQFAHLPHKIRDQCCQQCGCFMMGNRRNALQFLLDCFFTLRILGNLSADDH